MAVVLLKNKVILDHMAGQLVQPSRLGGGSSRVAAGRIQQHSTRDVLCLAAKATLSHSSGALSYICCHGDMMGTTLLSN